MLYKLCATDFCTTCFRAIKRELLRQNIKLHYRKFPFLFALLTVLIIFLDSNQVRWHEKNAFMKVLEAKSITFLPLYTIILLEICMFRVFPILWIKQLLACTRCFDNPQWSLLAGFHQPSQILPTKGRLLGGYTPLSEVNQANVSLVVLDADLQVVKVEVCLQYSMMLDHSHGTTFWHLDR